MQSIPELEIIKVIDGIDNAVDAKDWLKARSYFTEKIYVDFSSLSGDKPAEISADDLITAWQTNLYKEKKSFHLRGNHAVEVNGETASDFSKAYAINAIDEGPVNGIFEIWGDYTYTLAKVKTEWKVTGMSLFVVQTRGNKAIRTYLPS